MRNCNEMKEASPIETNGNCCCNCQNHVAYGQYVRGRGFVRKGWACTVGIDVDKAAGLEPERSIGLVEKHGFCELHTRREE